MATLVRAARRSELAQVFDLLEHAFPEAPRSVFVEQTERDPAFQLKHARVAVTNGRVVGYVRIFARTMLVRGHPVAAGGIGSVATAPAARRTGVATRLLEDAIAVMDAEGMPISFLFTGIPGFYARLGWQIVREPSFDVARKHLLGLEPDAAYDIAPMRAADANAAASLYERAITGSTGAIVRSGSAPIAAGDDGRCDLVACVGGAFVAYIRSRCRAYGHQILEAECEPPHERAVRALVLALAAHPCPCDRIVAIAPGDHPLAFALRALPSASETEDVRYPMMMRINAIHPLLLAIASIMANGRHQARTASVSLRFTDAASRTAALGYSADDVGVAPNATFSRAGTVRFDALATLDAIFGQQYPSELITRAAPLGAAEWLDALLPRAALRFWNTDRI